MEFLFPMFSGQCSHGAIILTLSDCFYQVTPDIRLYLPDKKHTSGVISPHLPPPQCLAKYQNCHN